LPEERTMIKKKPNCVRKSSPSVKSRTEQLGMRKKALRWALVYVDLGWPIVPLWSVDKNGKCLCHRRNCSRPGKHPHSRLAPNGIQDAARDKDKVKLWFASNDLNMGIITGPQSNLLVMEVDPDKGGDESLAKLEAKYGKLAAIEAVTGGGGKHLLMRYPKDGQIKNWVTDLGRGLTVKGHGDYIVACPSHDTNGDTYEWRDELAIVELPPCPEWFIETIEPDVVTHSPVRSGNI
jgi:hypothetical protein